MTVTSLLQTALGPNSGVWHLSSIISSIMSVKGAWDNLMCLEKIESGWLAARLAGFTLSASFHLRVDRNHPS